VNNSRQRDWSGELEESEFHLPFAVATEERQRPHVQDQPDYMDMGDEGSRGIGDREDDLVEAGWSVFEKNLDIYRNWILLCSILGVCRG
jgi:hypothetical protein